ncbi:MAG: hypothetical protein NC080_07245 [Paraprevotella sp.]|nr:hypothetical protein [Paraprevotella sp.]
MTNEEFIRLHLRDDVRTLALRGAGAGVDAKWCLQQIEGWQKAVDKLPAWAQTEGLWYPPSLSMEQCSSELAASYKRAVVERLLPETSRAAFADLTGGYGIDFSYIAPLFSASDYIERNAELCRIAEHNFSALGLRGINIVCSDSIGFLYARSKAYDLVYLDPARRDTAGRKTVAMEDCTPDVCMLQGDLLAASEYVVTKLSPMLDICAAMARLRNVCEVHVVCVKGECKELLLVQKSVYEGMPVYHVANLTGTEILEYTCTYEEKLAARPVLSGNCGNDVVGKFLYEPHAGILKAGLQDTLCQRYGVAKLHPMSNLFTSAVTVDGFPGRGFVVTGCCGFAKKELRAMLGDVSCANLTVRNFPATVAELRKKLHLREGGDVYLFATTMEDGSRALVRCSKHA